MHPPADTEVLEFPTSTVWFEKDGILCAKSKKSGPLSMEETKKVIADFKNFLGGRKVCMLIDTTYSNAGSKELREFAADEFPKFTRALAFVSGSPLGKMVANIFFSLKKQPYPVRMFTDEKAAHEWLRQYL